MPAELSPMLLRDLDPSQVRWYAVQAGWKPVEGIKRPVVVLNHPLDELTQIQIPLAGSERERVYLMGEAVRQLAEAEKRSPGEVLNDLAMPPGDVLRLQVESREADVGSLPLEEGLRLLAGGRDLLLAAACSALHPQPYFPRQSFKEAERFLESCRMGQTERGSYVATIATPVIPPLTPSLFDGLGATTDLAAEPYERRVTLLLMQALQTLRGALDHAKMEEVFQRVAQGISANFVEALASISPDDVRGTVKIGINWSRNRPQVPIHLPSRIAFAHAEFPIVRETGRRLRETIEPRRERVEGPILSLHAEPAQLFEEFVGRVTLRALIDSRAARVRFTLNEADYVRACDAHRDHRRAAVTGILRRGAEARFFDLAQPQKFQVMAPDPAIGEEDKP